MANSEREVLIRLKVEGDKSNKKAFQEVAKSAASSQKAVDKSAKDRERAEIRTAASVTRTDKTLFTNRMKAIRNRERVESRAMKARVDGERKAAREVQRLANQTAKAQVQAAQKYQDSQAQIKQGQTQIAERFNSGMGDALRFGRGLAMVGLIGEESTEKVIQGLIKITSAVDIVAGGIGMWVRYSNIMRDVAAMSKVAAAGQLALAAAQGKVAATGVAGAAGGGVGRTVGSGLAGAGGAKVAGVAGGSGIVGTVGASLGAFIGAVGAVTTVFETGRDVWQHGLMGGATPGSLSDTIANAEVSVANWAASLAGFDLTGGQKTKRIQGKQEGFRALTAAESSRRAVERQNLQSRMSSEGLPILQGRLAASRGTVATNQREGNEGAASVDADRKHLSILDAVREKQKEINATVRERQAGLIDNGQKVVDNLREQRDLHLNMAKQIREQGKSAAERFGALSARDQAKAQVAFQQVQAGTAGREAESLAERFGSKVISDTIAQRRRARASAAGFGETFGRGFEERASAAQGRGESFGRDAGVASGRVNELKERVAQSTNRMADQLKKLTDEMRTTQERIWVARTEDMINNEVQQRQALQQSE